MQHGIDVNARDQQGWDAISLAAFRGYDRVVVVLLESGANANNAMLFAQSRTTIEILENWGKRPRGTNGDGVRRRKPEKGSE